MTTRSPEERARSRAEARRRSRQLARGDAPSVEESTPEPEPQPRRGGLLRTLFPPAPPLPNRPDPLIGFDRSGAMRPVRERWFLLRSNLLAWLAPSVLAMVGSIASRFYQRGFLGLVGMLVLFGALIAAGWYGWQRPTLFGTAAGLLAGLVTSVALVAAFAAEGGLIAFTPVEVGVSALIEIAYLAGLGFIGGWYGGYLRRRQASLTAGTRRRR